MPSDDQIRDEFSPLIDDELDPETRATIEEQLSGSAELLRELDQFKKVDDLYGALSEVKAPEDFEARLAERMEPQVIPLWQRTAVRGLIPAVAAASLMVMAGGLWWLRPSVESSGSFTTARVDKAKDVPADYTREESESAAPAGGAASASVERSEALVSRAAPVPSQTKAGMAAEKNLEVALEPEVSGDAVVEDEMPLPPPPAAEPPPAPLPAQAAEQLESLGYLGTREPTPSTTADTRQSDERMEESVVATPRLNESDDDGALRTLASPPATEVPAPAPAMKELDTVSERVADATNRPVAMRRAAKADAATEQASPSETEIQAAIRRVLGTDSEFTLIEGVWTEVGYAGEATNSPTQGVSQVLRTAFENVGIKNFAQPIIYQLDGTWFRLEPTE